MKRWRPGDRREPVSQMIRVDQAGEYGATRIYAGQLAVMGDRVPLAREIVGMARDILGGNGILLENHVARQHADMEAIFTFEGTDSIQALIVRRDITGISAFR